MKKQPKYSAEWVSWFNHHRLLESFDSTCRQQRPGRTCTLVGKADRIEMMFRPGVP